MYFADLTPYRYVPALHGTLLNIGWLDAAHEYPRGDVAADLVEKMRWFASHGDVASSRGFHRCDLCPEPTQVFTRDADPARPRLLLGMAEVWIPTADTAADQWFVWPTLALHYVTDHGYLPPSEFLAALEVASLRTSEEANVDYERLVGVPSAT